MNRAGPIGFVDSWSRIQPVGKRRGSRILPTKVLIVVDAGETVTVAVPDSERDRLRLLYAPSRPDSPDGLYEFTVGDRATTFQACKPGQSAFGDHPQTQFPGYFLVKEAGCYRVDVTLLITANQPFGEWGKIFTDKTMTLAAIDRLVHHATILEMNVESYRRKAALKRKRGKGD